MTRPWPEVAAFYEGLGLPGRSVGALAALARKISESPLATGLFAWTSMHDLCIAQAESEADQAFGRLVKFLNELRWFPPEVLDPLRENPRSGDA